MSQLKELAEKNSKSVEEIELVNKKLMVLEARNQNLVQDNDQLTKQLKDTEANCVNLTKEIVKEVITTNSFLIFFFIV